MHSVTARAVSALLAAHEELGMDSVAALKRAGMLHLIEDIYRGAATTVPRGAFVRLARDCVSAFHLHDSRRDALPPYPISNFHLMCFSLLSCPTVGVAIETLRAFNRLAIGRRGRMAVGNEHGHTRLILDMGGHGRRSADAIITIYGLASVHRLLGWLTRAEIALHEVTLKYARTTTAAIFEEMLGCRPVYGSAYHSIVFDTAALDRPITRNHAELSELLQTFPFDFLPPDYGTDRLGDRVAAAISAALTRNEPPPDMIRLAAMFGLSVATFRRRIDAEGTSLTALRRDCRQKLAVALMQQPGLTVKEIASRVHFSDVAAFRRAFRDWTGQSPKDYRHAIRNLA